MNLAKHAQTGANGNTASCAPEKPALAGITLLHQDEALLVLNKPAGLLSVPVLRPQPGPVQVQVQLPLPLGRLR